MLAEYWKKVRSAVAWMVPFFVAVFLLFGCGSAGSVPNGAGAAGAGAVSETQLAADSGDGQELQSGDTKTQRPETETQIETQEPGSEAWTEAQGADLEALTEAQGAGLEARTETKESEPEAQAKAQEPEAAASVSEDGHYTSKEEVALYLHTFGHLPENYITKKDAEAAGWVSKEGNLWDVAPGMSIGGSRFGNYEGLLPDEKGRTWYECDIDFDGSFRGAKRIVYSNDGLIYYTEDHYKTFEQLY